MPATNWLNLYTPPLRTHVPSKPHLNRHEVSQTDLMNVVCGGSSSPFASSTQDTQSRRDTYAWLTSAKVPTGPKSCGRTRTPCMNRLTHAARTPESSCAHRGCGVTVSDNERHTGGVECEYCRRRQRLARPAGTRRPLVFPQRSGNPQVSPSASPS